MCFNILTVLILINNFQFIFRYICIRQYIYKRKGIHVTNNKKNVPVFQSIDR